MIFISLNNKPIKVFITYAWEDEAHKDWAKQLADKLITEGIEAIIDQYDLNPGDRIPQFMEASIKEAVYVLVICTPKYKRKADKRLGGVGYESNLISGEIYTKGSKKRKYIPVLRRGSMEKSIPAFLAGAYAVDLSEDLENYVYDKNFRELAIKLRGGRRRPIASFADRAIVRKEDIAGKTIHATVGGYFAERKSFTVTLYDDDLFETNSIKQLAIGDTLLVGGMRDTVTGISILSDGEIHVEMEEERNISFFERDEEYMIAYNTDLCRQYMHLIAEFSLPAANDIIYEDYTEPERDDPIITRGLEEILKIKAEKEKTSIGFDYYATMVTINENLEISIISQGYDVAQ